MPETHDAPQMEFHLGPLRVFVHSVFVHRQRFPEVRRAGHRGPLLDNATTYEDDDPWRLGRAIAVRVPLTRLGFVLGYWELPDPTRIESALWESGDAQLLVPGITATQIRTWPRPDEIPSTEGTGMADSEGVEVLDVFDEDEEEEFNVDGSVVRIVPWAG